MTAPARAGLQVEGDVSGGQLATGKYVVQLNESAGATVNLTVPEEPAVARPRPVDVLPRPVRGLLGRADERTSLLAAVAEQLPAELSGEPGIGKSALLRSAVRDARSAEL